MCSDFFDIVSDSIGAFSSTNKNREIVNVMSTKIIFITAISSLSQRKVKIVRLNGSDRNQMKNPIQDPGQWRTAFTKQTYNYLDVNTPRI